MAEESFEEKTEQPTPRKREEVRKKGQVAKSREIPSLAVLLVGLISIAAFGSHMYYHIGIIMTEGFSFFTLSDLSMPDFLHFSKRMITLFLLTMLPLLLALFLTAIVSNVMQVGFLLSAELIKPNLSKINPIKGFGRLFSSQSLMELLKSLLKLAVVGTAACLTIRSEMKHVPYLWDMEVNSIVVYLLKIIFKISIRCILAMVVLVAIDYAFQRWEFLRKIKMTKKEVKDEYKRVEGDPLVKSRIKGIQREMAKKRMMQAVPKADVVIVNPTRLAVALQYESTRMSAPRVIAKGAGELARRIKKVAESHGVPIVENRELAQRLYSLVAVDQEIPPVLYEAVAEVLAYIYRLKGKLSSLAS
ncbi:MAG: flagellar biosynthesis protein FlhB [Thermodesulfobacteriota bacterium]